MCVYVCICLSVCIYIYIYIYMYMYIHILYNIGAFLIKLKNSRILNIIFPEVFLTFPNDNL